MELAEVREKAAPILKRRAVTRAGVFGSVARGEPSARDVDLLVEMRRPYGLFSFLALKQELEAALGKDVDLVAYDTLKPALRERILKDEISIL